MKRKLSYLALILFLAILITTTNISITEANNQREIRVYVDGQNVAFTDAKPYIDQNNRTLVPVRFPSEAIGADVSWNGQTQQVTITKGTRTVILTVNKTDYIVNGKTLHMDTAMVFNSQQGRNFVPIRFILEGLGAEVDWQLIENKNIGIVHAFTQKQTNEQKEAIKKEIENWLKAGEVKKGEFSAQAMAELEKLPTFANLGMRLRSSDGTLFYPGDALEFAKKYLEVRVNYDGTSQAVMDQWERDMLGFYGPNNTVNKSKNNYLNAKEIAVSTALVEINKIEVKDKFYVNAVVEGVVNGKDVIYISKIEVGVHPTETSKLVVGNVDWTQVK